MRIIKPPRRTVVRIRDNLCVTIWMKRQDIIGCKKQNLFFSPLSIGRPWGAVSLPIIKS